jgi:predicted small lipoprotein YifL
MALAPGGQAVVKIHWLALGVALASALVACGQKGPLYLPEKTGEVVTRPTQTSAPEPGATPGESTGAPNSPQTVDSPEGQTSPAPEVVVPTPAERDEKKKQDAARPR